MDKQPLVRVQAGNNSYVVYADGSTEGFGDSVMVVNYHQTLMDQAVAAVILKHAERAREAVASSLSVIAESDGIEITRDGTIIGKAERIEEFREFCASRGKLLGG